MAGREEPTEDRQRVLTLVAVAFASAASALAFGRVFMGSATAWRLVAVSLACVALAGVMRKRNVFIAMAVSAAALFLVATEMILPATTDHGIPTAQTLSAVWHAVSLFGEQARTQPAPTYPFAPLVLAAMAAAWAAAFASHSLCVRAGSPLFALVPSVALVGFADAVMPDGARPVYAFLFLSGALAMVFADSSRRFAKWGPVKPWSERRRTVPGAGARRIGALVVATALIAPGLLPWYHSGSAWKGHGVRSAGEGEPTASFDTTLPAQSPTPLYEVRTTTPTYLRLLSLDVFDGTTWWPNTVAQAPGEPSSLQPPAWAVSAAQRQGITQQITVLSPSSPWIPMAFQPTSVSPWPAGTTCDPLGTAARSSSDLLSGHSYTVASELAIPTPAQLDGAPDPRTLATLGQPDPAVLNMSLYSAYTQLPTKIPKSVYALTHQIVRDAPNEYRKMLAIQDYLRTFSYSTSAIAPAGVNPVAYFLENSKAGFCQQFAGSMALMARILGYPARVAVGFQPGTKTGADTYVVTAQQLHTWPEILFPGYGWVAFEPTPTRMNPTAQSYLFPAPPSPHPIGHGASGVSQGGTNRTNSRSAKRGISGNVTGGAPHARRLHIDPLSALVMLTLALLVLFPLGRGMLRRFPRGRGPRRAAISAYHLFELRSADVGLGRAPGETPREHQERLSRTISFSDGHLGRLVDTLTKAAWSPGEPGPAEVSAARREAGVAARDVVRSVSVAKRVMGWYRPGI